MIELVATPVLGKQMSAGNFKVSKYEGDVSANIYSCRIQEETEQLDIGGATNDPPAGAAVVALGGLKLRAGASELGVKARTVTLKFTAGAPTGYTGDNVKVPILTKSFFDAIDSGDTGTYLGSAVEVVRKTPETYQAA